MARILADKDIRPLIGSVLVNADEELINPNGIELRLGKHVHFHSTGEEGELEAGHYLKVSPGETVTISSMEVIDFKLQTAQAAIPGCTIMGFITPTTTMMREGISLATTKIDVGFHGNLNWGLRNGSTKDLLLGYGEPIFKLTVFVLAEDESPDIPYGERAKDSYQNTEGIKRSSRKIPVDVPKSKIVSSGFEKLDPKKQLREAGYPFDHIGTELTTLHGKFEVVSSDMRVLRDEFQRRTVELSNKIETETSVLTGKLGEMRTSLLEIVESLFDRKFIRITGVILGGIPIMYGGITYLEGTTIGGPTLAFIAVIGGMAIILVSYWVAQRGK